MPGLRRGSLPGVIVLAAAVNAPAVSGAELVDAVRERDATAVRALLAGQADPNVTAVDGSTPLLHAAHLADVEIAERLLAAGADPNAANRYGLAPLHAAARVADVALIEPLLAAGAAVDLPLPEGETALMLASRTSRVDAVQLLIAHGADVNAVETWQGQTALMYAAAANRAEVAAALIAAGADVDAATPLNTLPDRIPAARFNVEFPKGGMTPLLFAAREGALQTARVLVDAGADLDRRSPEGFSALVLAIHNLHFDTAALLVAAGADPNGGALYAVVNARNRVPLDGPQPEPTGTRSERELLEALLARGPDLLDRPPQPLPDTDIGFGAVPVQLVDTALIRAARSADIESMRLLIDAGADPAQPEPSGLTAVHAVTEGPEIPPLTVVDRERPAEPRAIAALEFLLEHGLDLSAKGPQGATAAHTAARRGYTNVIRFLVAHGVNLDAADEQGLTPLDYALGRSPVLFGTPPRSDAAAALLRELGAVEGAGASPEGAR